MEIVINTKNSTNTFNVSFAEPSETDDLIELIKQTRLIASIIWFTLAFLGLIGKNKNKNFAYQIEYSKNYDFVPLPFLASVTFSPSS